MGRPEGSGSNIANLLAHSRAKPVWAVNEGSKASSLNSLLSLISIHRSLGGHLSSSPTQQKPVPSPQLSSLSIRAADTKQEPQLCGGAYPHFPVLTENFLPCLFNDLHGRMASMSKIYEHNTFFLKSEVSTRSTIFL